MRVLLSVVLGAVALWCSGCLDGAAVDFAFCDVGEPCFSEPSGSGVFCDGVECPEDPCAAALGCNEWGACVAVALPEDADDHDACTVDTCDGPEGWTHERIAPADLDDGDPCTADACNTLTGPEHVNTCS